MKLASHFQWLCLIQIRTVTKVNFHEVIIPVYGSLVGLADEQFWVKACYVVSSALALCLCSFDKCISGES